MDVSTTTSQRGNGRRQGNLQRVFEQIQELNNNLLTHIYPQFVPKYGTVDDTLKTWFAASLGEFMVLSQRVAPDMTDFIKDIFTHSQSFLTLAGRLCDAHIITDAERRQFMDIVTQNFTPVIERIHSHAPSNKKYMNGFEFQAMQEAAASKDAPTHSHAPPNKKYMNGFEVQTMLEAALKDIRVMKDSFDHFLVVITSLQQMLETTGAH
jgi:hypothetical protein